MSTLLATCISATAEEVDAYDATEREIKYATFARLVGRETVKEINAATGFPIRKDWHVSFGRGVFRGQPVAVMHHSAIHHFYSLTP